MAIMSPKNFVAHIDHEVARKFATDILDLLEPAKSEIKAKPKSKAKPNKTKPKEKIEEK